MPLTKAGSPMSLRELRKTSLAPAYTGGTQHGMIFVKVQRKLEKIFHQEKTSEVQCRIMTSSDIVLVHIPGQEPDLCSQV